MDGVTLLFHEELSVMGGLEPVQPCSTSLRGVFQGPLLPYSSGSYKSFMQRD